MPTLTVTDARKNLFGLIDDVADEHRGYCIVGKRNQAVLISMEDWNAIQESLYLNSFPGLGRSYTRSRRRRTQRKSRLPAFGPTSSGSWAFSP